MKWKQAPSPAVAPRSEKALYKPPFLNHSRRRVNNGFIFVLETGMRIDGLKLKTTRSVQMEVLEPSSLQ